MSTLDCCGELQIDRNETVFSSFSIFPHQENAKIVTEEFLAACNGILNLIDSLGKAFAPVKYDIKGNITKLTNKYKENPNEFRLIEDMIMYEREQGNMVVRDALQWLRRGLHFIACFFQYLIDDRGTNKESLSVHLKKAYEKTLERYHGWMGSQLFNVLNKFVPKRKCLLSALAFNKDGREGIVLRDMKLYTSQLSICVQNLTNFYIENNLETYERV